MRPFQLLWTCMIGVNLVFAAEPFISGAGASFPAPLYVRWAERYHQLYAIQINYQAIGSGGGIKQVVAGTIDFGATDKPLSQTELQQMHLVQFPMILGAVVPVYHLPGVGSGQLQLSGPVLAKIFLGQIKHWRHPDILALNPNVTIPDLPIIVIHRSESSGTTYLFTSYLSEISSIWRNQVGRHSAILWPVGLGAKGNEGVAVYVAQQPGTIGYVEYAYVAANQLSYAKLQNKAGYFVLPEAINVQHAAEYADWEHAELGFCNADGPLSWPISGASFILMRQSDLAHAKPILAFFRWALEQDGSFASQLHFVTLPKKAGLQVRHIWEKGFGYDKATVLFP